MAIKIKEVTGLRIAGCTIAGALAVPTTIQDPVTKKNVTFPSAGGIIGVSQDPPVTGTVKDIAGDLLIEGNMIDIGVKDPASRTFGIQMNLKGQSTRANLTIAGNTVSNVTAHGVVLREIPGLAVVSKNPKITTGAVGGRPGLSDQFVDGIMCQGSGNYMIKDNTIQCGYENSAGIRLQSTSPSAPITATVDGNNITMSRPSGAVAGDESAGIELRRNCVGCTVSNNKIFGRARAALSLVATVSPAPPPPFILSPARSRFTSNDHSGFTSLLADIIVFPEVTDTTIDDGSGTIINQGQNTVVPKDAYKELDPNLLGPLEF